MKSDVFEDTFDFGGLINLIDRSHCKDRVHIYAVQEILARLLKTQFLVASSLLLFFHQREFQLQIFSRIHSISRHTITHTTIDLTILLETKIIFQDGP